MSPTMVQYAGGILVEQNDYGNRKYVPQPSFTPKPEDPAANVVVAPPVVNDQTNAIGAPLTAPIPGSVVDAGTTTETAPAAETTEPTAETTEPTSETTEPTAETAPVVEKAVATKTTKK
jgi:hypothetical protein